MNLKSKKFILYISLFAVVAIASLAIWYNFSGRLGSFAELSVGMKTPEEFVSLAQRYEKVRQFEDAISSYKAAIDLEPGLQLAAYSALARIYKEELSEKDSGLAHVYLRGLSVSPKSRVLMMGLAEHYERIEEYIPAFQWYQKILELYPQDRYTQMKITEIQKKF